MQIKDKTVIGLVIEDMNIDFAGEIIRGALTGMPKNKDVHLVVISGKHDETTDVSDPEYRYKKVYNMVYHLENRCRFDGLIVTIAGIAGSDGVLPFIEGTDNYKKLPKVYIATSPDRTPYVNYDNEKGIREAIDYLVNVNGYSRICMLGGRSDNPDAVVRREIFIKSLKENHVRFDESMYEPSDMSFRSEKAATNLLRRNPDMQAVFCVNDAVAVGLYNVFKNRGIVPGKDVLVFGFDNTYMTGDMNPTLASVGTYGGNMGQIAMTKVLDFIDGKEVTSVIIPTRLYGKESLDYESLDFVATEMARGNKELIGRMFDECYYRYSSSERSREEVDLKRLNYEIISRMLTAARQRYISKDEFGEIGRMIDVFFANGAIEYTDSQKFIYSIGKLQSSMFIAQKSVAASVMINRLFLRMKDMAIRSISERRNFDNQMNFRGRSGVQEFLIEVGDDRLDKNEVREKLIHSFDKLGFTDASLLLFDQPVITERWQDSDIPDIIRLRCVIRHGELYVIPEGRQECLVSNIFMRDEVMSSVRGHIAFPVTFGHALYGYLVCGTDYGDLQRAEYIVIQIGRVLHG